MTARRNNCRLSAEESGRHRHQITNHRDVNREVMTIELNAPGRIASGLAEYIKEVEFGAKPRSAIRRGRPGLWRLAVLAKKFVAFHYRERLVIALAG
jgi:hypothetical protein